MNIGRREEQNWEQKRRSEGEEDCKEEYWEEERKINILIEYK
jgi:hypothetical protein